MFNKQEEKEHEITVLRTIEARSFVENKQIYRRKNTMFDLCDPKDPFDLGKMSFDSKEHQDNKSDDFEEVALDGKEKEPAKEKKCTIL